MFKPELFIKIAADDITLLRKGDVYRILNTAGDKKRTMVNFIRKHRPDLAGEVAECLAYLRTE